MTTKPVKKGKTFHVEWKNTNQKIAWTVLDTNDITFLLGPAGTAKTFLSVAYGISEVLSKRRRKLILTRPVVDAGEKLGFLP